MPLSISASEHRKATRALTILLGAMLVYVCSLEVVTRLAFPRINHVWRTIREDHLTAVLLHPSAASNSETMLMVGNSYLEVGVNRENLQQEIAPTFSIAYLPMSGTSYLDWYFGLRKLFMEGSRPAIVGVCLSTRDLISDATYGGSFAHTLMLRSDLLRVKKASHLDNTMTSDYFFDSLSSWMGHRAEIHNWLLRKAAPSVEKLTPYVRPEKQSLPPSDVILAKALARLRMLNQLAQRYGARFFLLIPPTMDVRDASNEIQAAAAKEGILVLLPFQHAELPGSVFLDGAHLNPQGAAIFTARLGPTLLQSLYQN